MVSIEPVVCASATGPGLARCLDAVAAQARSGLWLALAGVDASCEVEGVQVVRAPGPGLAAARNAALAASTAEVLAFVEEDVVVGSGWLAALEAAWDAAPEHVAAVGGPIALEFDDEPPRWLGGGLHAGFATLDYRDAPLILDPAVRTLHGANLSVRCAALRALGGFFPARGHRDGRDWFSEEHHAQRELAEAGWEIRYEPAARVARVPAAEMLRPARVVRRRWRYGARMRVVGQPRRAAVALRQALSSVAGVPLAAARRDPALVMERAARAAENVGLLAGAPIARQDFRETGTRPFDHEIPPVAEVAPRGSSARWRKAPTRSDAAAILLYHRVDDPATGPAGMCVAPDHFAEQMEVLAREREVIALDDLVASFAARRVPPGAVAVTFDDGYLDVLVNARPRLEAAGVPSTLFVATGHVADQRPFFWDELDRLLLGHGPYPSQLTLILPGGERAWRTDTPERRAKARKQIHDLIQPAAPETIEHVLADLAAWTGLEPSPDAPRAMTVDELRTLAQDPLVTIGAHTRRHANLGFADATTQRDEIVGSRNDLSDWLQLEPPGFAYPFGIPGVDFDATTRRVVAEAGFRYAVANHPGSVDNRCGLYALPRHFAPDMRGVEFWEWLRSALGR